MSTRAPSLRIVCPDCPPVQGRPVVIELAGGEETVRCPQCTAYFRVQTVSADDRPEQRVLGDGQSHYRATFHTTHGAPITQEFVGPLGMQLSGGDTVSLVWEGRHLRGLANQTQRLWYPLGAYAPTRDPLRVNGRIAGAVALAVALAMLVTYRDVIAGALLGGGILGALLVLLAVAIACAPWVSDTLARRSPD